MSTENAKNTFKIEENNLLKTGEFARLANINRDTLTFYIKKKLISPVYIGKNKYKYFSPEQVQTISFIKYLRRCMMPIETIRTILSDPSNGQMRFHLLKQREFLSEQLELLKEATCFIEDYRNEREFLDSMEPEIPFIQYCEKQTVNVFPLRFCQSFLALSDLENTAGYLNELSHHMLYQPSVCLLPLDTRSCAEFCSKAKKETVFNNSENISDSDYTMKLEEGFYAMIIGRSCTEKMDANLSLLREKITASGYRPEGNYLFLFVETSLLKIPESSGQRYLMKMKVTKTDAPSGKQSAE